jgi:hypothetical protein
MSLAPILCTQNRSVMAQTRCTYAPRSSFNRPIEPERPVGAKALGDIVFVFFALRQLFYIPILHANLLIS